MVHEILHREEPLTAGRASRNHDATAGAGHAALIKKGVEAVPTNFSAGLEEIRVSSLQGHCNQRPTPP
jgi:hypothetical protein